MNYSIKKLKKKNGTNKEHRSPEFKPIDHEKDPANNFTRIDFVSTTAKN
jgi:hypothetical protein